MRGARFSGVAVVALLAVGPAAARASASHHHAAMTPRAPATRSSAAGSGPDRSSGHAVPQIVDQRLELGTESPGDTVEVVARLARLRQSELDR